MEKEMTKTVRYPDIGIGEQYDDEGYALVTVDGAALGRVDDMIRHLLAWKDAMARRPDLVRAA